MHGPEQSTDQRIHSPSVYGQGAKPGNMNRIPQGAAAADYVWTDQSEG